MKIYLVRNLAGKYLNTRHIRFPLWLEEDEAELYHTEESAQLAGESAFDFDDDCEKLYTIECIDTEAAIQVLRDLFEAGNLDDHFYSVRAHEALGWDGPRMVKWGLACEAAHLLMGTQ